MKTFILLAITVFAGVDAQFSSTGQQQILAVHNTLRSSIAKGTYVAKGTKKPTGSNILKMKWDAGVAQSAQNYANTCPTGHSGAAGLGENLYWYWTSGSLSDLNRYGADASKAWEKEFQDYGWKANKPFLALFNTGIGHATQMAWATTGLIGCGVKACKDGNWNKVAVVCQYKPAGNYLNQNIYNTGATCSACPKGTKCETGSGLCIDAQFSSTGQQQILAVHNTLRSSIAKGTYVAKGTKKSTGSNILKLKWDANVAQSAQKHASTCPTSHSRTAGLGEKMYWYWTSETIGDLNKYGVDASKAWERELQEKGWNSNLFNDSLFKIIGHASQMAWANTGFIGCGVKACKEGTRNKIVVVCQYKLPGNYMNQHIYNTGATCSACPSGTKCETGSGLCV